MIKKLFYFLVFCVVCSAHAANINAVATTYQFKSERDAERYSNFTAETRCIVCQFQNIADSNSPLAGSIRTKIYELINEGKSDQDIKNYLTKRYGESILLKPRFNTTTAVLWLFPALALALLALIFIYLYKGKPKT